jgi:hypothetical protein
MAGAGKKVPLRLQTRQKDVHARTFELTLEQGTFRLDPRPVHTKLSSQVVRLCTVGRVMAGQLRRDRCPQASVWVRTHPLTGSA